VTGMSSNLNYAIELTGVSGIFSIPLAASDGMVLLHLSYMLRLEFHAFVFPFKVQAFQRQTEQLQTDASVFQIMMRHIFSIFTVSHQ
jgi:hypothetical protein